VAQLATSSAPPNRPLSTALTDRRVGEQKWVDAGEPETFPRELADLGPRTRGVEHERAAWAGAEQEWATTTEGAGDFLVAELAAVHGTR
jgi:hypothetical protein